MDILLSDLGIIGARNNLNSELEILFFLFLKFIKFFLCG